MRKIVVKIGNYIVGNDFFTFFFSERYFKVKIIYKAK